MSSNMIPKVKELKLISIYLYICDIYDFKLRNSCERFSNNNHPAFTVQARTLNPGAGEGQNPYTFNPNLNSENPTIFGRSVRIKRYRYTEWDEGSAGSELYDYETDPNEFNNLANDPEYRDLVKELSGILHSSYKAN